MSEIKGTGMGKSIPAARALRPELTSKDEEHVAEGAGKTCGPAAENIALIQNARETTACRRTHYQPGTGHISIGRLASRRER
jgi:hypothetical protein